MFAERIWRWLGASTIAGFESQLAAGSELLRRHQNRIEALEQQIRMLQVQRRMDNHCLRPEDTQFLNQLQAK